MGISQQQALDCFASNDLIGIGMEADSVRRGLHPDGVVTYTVDRAFLFDNDTAVLLEALEPAVAEGVTTIRIVTPPDGSTTLAQMEESLTVIRHRFAALQIQALTVSEVAAMAVSIGLSEADVLGRLRSAGLDAIEGDDDGVSPQRWLQLHAAAHSAGLRSQACLTFGGPVEAEAFVEQLMALQDLQEESAGFTSLSLQGFQPSGGRAEFERPTAVEYLRTLAIARMVLDNIDHVESSGIDEGLKVMQMALRFGANDGGTIPGPESKHPASFTESDLRRVIRDAGFSPVERDTLYRTMFLNN